MDVVDITIGWLLTNVVVWSTVTDWRLGPSDTELRTWVNVTSENDVAAVAPDVTVPEAVAVPVPELVLVLAAELVLDWFPDGDCDDEQA